MDQIVDVAVPALGGAIPIGAIASFYIKRTLGVTDGLQKQVFDQKDDFQKQINALHLEMIQQYVPRTELEKHFERFAEAQKEITKMLYEGFEELRKEIAHISKNQANTRVLADLVQARRGEL